MPPRLRAETRATAIVLGFTRQSVTGLPQAVTRPTPLRTVRETFASHGSMSSPARIVSKDAPVRGIPAIVGVDVSILSPLYACEDHLASRFAG